VLAAPPESKDSLGNLRHGLSGTCTVVGAAYKWNFHRVGQQGTPSDDRQGNGINPLALPYDSLHNWDTRAKAASKPLRVFVYPYWTHTPLLVGQSRLSHLVLGCCCGLSDLHAEGLVGPVCSSWSLLLSVLMPSNSLRETQLSIP
jgi:hypothetical protein